MLCRVKPQDNKQIGVVVKLSQSKVGTTEGVEVKSKDQVQMGEQANDIVN